MEGSSSSTKVGRVFSAGIVEPVAVDLRRVLIGANARFEGASVYAFGFGLGESIAKTTVLQDFAEVMVGLGLSRADSSVLVNTPDLLQKSCPNLILFYLNRLGDLQEKHL